MKRFIPITPSRSWTLHRPIVTVKVENESTDEDESRVNKNACGICKKVFASKGSLQKHELVHQEKSLSCPQCDLKFRRSHHLQGHIASHKNFRFQCEKCRMRFRSQNILDDHQKRCGFDASVKVKSEPKFVSTIRERLFNHHNPVYSPHKTQPIRKRFACTKCDLKFAKPHILKNHLARHKNFRFACEDSCGLVFGQLKFLLVHQERTGHKSTAGRHDLRCEKCDMKFTSLAVLKYHIKHHDKYFYVCVDSCGLKFSRLKILLEHCKKTGHEKPKNYFTGPGSKCPKCDAKFISSEGFRKHLKAHENPKKLRKIEKNQPRAECPKCGVILHKESLQYHLRHHNSFRYACNDSCGLKFSNRKSLLEHRNKSGHESALRFFTGPGSKCPKCDEKFDKSYNFNRHLAKHEKVVKKFHCTKCDVTLASLRGFQYHTLHHDKFRHACIDSCGMKFSIVKFLRNHQRQTGHGGPAKTFTELHGKCPQCGMNFKLAKDFYTHLRHHDRFTYECVECDVKFPTKKVLTRHQKRFGHENPPEASQFVIECPRCDMTFIREAEFNQHLARHDSFKHLCEECGMTLPEIRYLISHQKRTGHGGGDKSIVIEKPTRMRTRSQSMPASKVYAESEDENLVIPKKWKKIVQTQKFKDYNDIQSSSDESDEIIEIYSDSETSVELFHEASANEIVQHARPFVLNVAKINSEEFEKSRGFLKEVENADELLCFTASDKEMLITEEACNAKHNEHETPAHCEKKNSKIADYIVKREAAALSPQYGCVSCQLEFADNLQLWHHLNQMHLSPET